MKKERSIAEFSSPRRVPTTGGEKAASFSSPTALERREIHGSRELFFETARFHDSPGLRAVKISSFRFLSVFSPFLSQIRVEQLRNIHLRSLCRLGRRYENSYFASWLWAARFWDLLGSILSVQFLLVITAP